MDRKTVAQYMGGEGFGEAGASAGAMTRLFNSGPSERVVGSVAGKQPGGGPAQAPPVSQDLEQLRRKHHVPIALPFTLLDAEHHPPTVDISGVEDGRLPRRGGRPHSTSSGRRGAWGP